MNARLPLTIATSVLLVPHSISAALAGTNVGPNPRGNGVVFKGREVHHGHGESRGSRGKRNAGHSNSCPNVIFHHRGLYCETITLPGPAAAAGAVFTPGMAQSAVRNLPMPALRLHVQPAGPTLVNADTIFYAEPQTFNSSVDLLGHTIDVRAKPVGFTWVHGDGTSQSTSSAGAPYPSREITHRYMSPSEAVSARVDTVYEVEFSIDGGGWDELDAPLMATGPSTSIEVQEAAPALTR